MRSADECEMSRSCQSATFSRPTTRLRARPARDRRSARRPSGSACAASPTSPSSRPRTAPRPRAPRCGRDAGSRSRTGRATWRTVRASQSSSACRSRAITCVDTGSGSRPRRAHAMRSTSGSIAAYVPTVPENWPTRQPRARARGGRGRGRARTPSRRASSRTSSARRGCRASGRCRSSCRCSSARAHDGRERAVDPARGSARLRRGSAARAPCRRRRTR